MATDDSESKLAVAESGASGALSALTLDWVLGFNHNLVGGMHSLCDASRDAVLYSSGHTGVVYDYALRQQHLLQGHCNAITALCVSADKRWVATADAGADSMIVVWDSHSCTPIKTIFTPHPNGVAAMAMSADAMHLVTVSHVDEEAPGTQEIAVWSWTGDSEGPVASCAVPTQDLQTCVKFNPLDVTQVATNGADRVVFWMWSPGKMRFFAPPVSQRDLRQSVGAFTVSEFLAVPGKAVTATSDGDVVLWEMAVNDDPTAKQEWSALKVVRLTKDKCMLEYLGTVHSYLVAGSADGVVRLFDATLRLIAWFEDIAGGAITSVSFAAPDGSAGDLAKDAALHASASVDGGSLDVPDFLVGTRQSLIVGMQSSMFDELTPDMRHGSLLVQGMDAAVHAVSTHPFQTQLALTTDSGAVHVWDYSTKQLLMVRLLDAAVDRPCSLAYDTQGRFLVLGTTAGGVLIMDPQQLTDSQTKLEHSDGAVTEVRFSNCGTFMATADASRHVALYRYMSTTVTAADAAKAGATTKKEWELEEGEVEERKTVEQWVYLGRARSHTRAITSLEFGVSGDGSPLLASTGEDKRLVEYDLMESSVTNGVVIKGKRAVVDQSAVPTACFWMPGGLPTPGAAASAGASAGAGAGAGAGADAPAPAADTEQIIVTANDEFKFKLWNNDSKICRCTRLGPTFGGPITRMQQLPARSSDSDGAPGCCVYQTADRVVGLVLLPFEGNPHASMGIIAHPQEVSACVPTYDGSMLVTAGGSDATVNLWRVSVPAMQAAAAAGGTGAAPFLAMLDGGAHGEFYAELRDFFMYAQIRAQGENSMSPRRIGDTMPLSELPNVFRAAGFYPTEQEVTNAVNEVRYSRFKETGAAVEHVTLDDVVRLYVNHRPVLGVGRAAIEDAMRILQKRAAVGGGVGAGAGAGAGVGGVVGGVDLGGPGDVSLPWAGVVEALTAEGEALPADELKRCVEVLTGEPLDAETFAGASTVTPSDVANDLLGFE